MKRIIAFADLFGSAAYAVNVVDVKVDARDGFGGDTGSVLARCQTKPGTAYDPVTVSRDVKSLNGSNEYQDISAQAEEVDGGVRVTFVVFRKMRYNGPPVIKGAEFFSASKIASAAKLKDGMLYGEADFAEAAERVRELYNKKHFPDTKVTPVPKMMAGSINCTLTFMIDEGARVKVSKYVFDGAENVEESELRDAIGVYPWWNPIGWFADDPVTPAQRAQAAQKAKRHYAELGYLDATVSDPVFELDEASGTHALVFKVDEGPRYTVGSAKIDGVKSYAVDEVARRSDMPQPGDTAGIKTLEDAAHSIEITMGSGDIGLADTKVSYKHIPRPDEPSVVDLVFSVVEGVPVVINQIRIRGNDYTKDKVIRREIKLAPGNRMLADAAEQSKKRLENLDYFSQVRYSLVDASRGKDGEGREYRDLVYEVTEKNTGNFMVGIGASSVDSVYVSAEVQQANFDIFAPQKYFRGGGQKGRLYVAAGPRIQTYEAEVTEPWFLDRELELTVRGYRRQRWYDEYDIIRSGGAASISYPMKLWNPFARDPAKRYTTFGSFGFALSGEFIEFDDADHGYWRYKGRTVSLAEKGGEDDRYGDAFEGVGRLFWSRATLDRPRIPTSGSRTHVFFDLGQGDNEYWRLGFTHRTYYSPWRRLVKGDSWLKEHVFMIGLRAETIDAISSEVPIYNRMFLGGPRSIRGIEYRNVSPMARKLRGRRDPDGEPSNSYMPWGGQTLFCANFEYTVPIVKMLRLAAFSDLGSVGEDEFDLDMSDTFAWTVGLGVRIDIPMFPIRLDFATPVKKPDHADKEIFSFSIGYDF